MKAYHGVLQQLNIKPLRSLEDDLVLQTNVMSYGGSGTTISLPAKKKADTKKSSVVKAAADPDFTKMTSAQKVAYQKARWDRILGG